MVFSIFCAGTVAQQEPKYLPELIRQLGSDGFDERERASRRLVACGPQAAPLLRKATSDSDAEVARRAGDCLQQLELNAHAALPSAVVRLLIRRRPAGTVAALLAYLPSADEEAVEEEILYGLSALAFQEKKINSGLLAALQDPNPVRHRQRDASWRGTKANHNKRLCVGCSPMLSR